MVKHRVKGWGLGLLSALFGISVMCLLIKPSAASTDLSPAQATAIYRQGLVAILAYMAETKALFPDQPVTHRQMVKAQTREEIRALWGRFSEYMIVLDQVISARQGYYRLPGQRRKAAAFKTLYQAFVVQYRFAMAFIVQVEKVPSYAVILNEAMPQYGLPAGSYAALKYRFLHVGRASQFAAFSVIFKLYQTLGLLQTSDTIAADKAAIWAMGKGQGEVLTFKNALTVVKQKAFSTWFPVQKDVSEWMGDTQVYHRASLVTAAQVQAFRPMLQPGDVLLERREWFLSNVGLPGYWPHAALYIGDAASRRAFFDAPAVRAWVQRQGQASGDFEALLKAQMPQSYRMSEALLADGHYARVIEAISEGVSLTSLEHSAEADSVAVVRPRLSKVEKARAILMAFKYLGKPYDFEFDFRTDQALVCTELIYKVYEPSQDYSGLKLETRQILQRPIVSANDMVAMMDQQWHTPQQQFELIIFLDGREWEGKAVRASVPVFRASWKRPKWHIFLNPKRQF